MKIQVKNNENIPIHITIPNGTLSSKEKKCSETEKNKTKIVIKIKNKILNSQFDEIKKLNKRNKGLFIKVMISVKVVLNNLN